MNPVVYTPSRYVDYLRETIDFTGYSLERRINELRLRFSEERLDVFVSHKSDDTDTAQEVAETIAKSGLTVYLDVLDSNIAGDEPELVDYINTVISCCNSLIAVVSYNTVSSWWVPLEIGIAITKDLYLGTFSRVTKQDLPSYLWKWPVLTNMIALESWCKEYKKKPPTQLFYEYLKQWYPSMFEREEKADNTSPIFIGG